MTDQPSQEAGTPAEEPATAPGAALFDLAADEIAPARVEVPEPPQRTPTVGTLVVGARLGPYVIEAPLGQGGMGLVYRARHALMGRVAAVKVLRRCTCERTRARFLREARVAGRFRHPAVVEFYDFAESKGISYLAMELVSGISLAELMRGRLGPDRIARIFGRLLEAIAAAHAAGVVHRDLKPPNVMVTPGDGVKVLDFGLACMLEASLADGESHPAEVLTSAGDFVGTPAYAAPEQIRSEEASERTDIYQVGIMLFEAFSGRLPFRGASKLEVLARHLDEPLPRLADIEPGVPRVRALDRVLARAAAKRPDDRFASALELRAALLELYGAERRAAPPGLLVLERSGARRKLFVFFGESLVFGRGRGERSDAAILRVLPCRDEARDPENWAASLAISKVHGEIVVKGGQVLLLDRSTRGIRIDGAEVCRERPVALPDRFALDLGRGGLLLDGRVERTGGSTGAVVITRRANAPEHAYALVVRSLDLGVVGVEGRLVVEDGTPRLEIEPGERRTLEAGLRIRIGEVEMSYRDAEDSDFLTP